MPKLDATPSLYRQLNQLEQADLVRLAATQPEIAYLFRHALVQESAYQTLVRADRRRVHRAAGEALEALFAGQAPPPDLVPQLARHFEEAADEARAIHYYTLAGDAALARYANQEAVATYTCALACAERAPTAAVDWRHIFDARGRAMELNSQYVEALRNYEAMAQRAAALGDRRLALAASVARTQLYATATTLFDPPQAERLSEAALMEARALGDGAAEAKVLWNQLNLYRFTGRTEQARKVGERSQAIARRLDLKGQLALTTNDLIHVYSHLGQWPEAQRAFEEASRAWRELNNVAMLADCLSTTSLYQSLQGAFQSALSLSQEAYRLSLSIGNLWGQSYSRSGMSWPYWYMGQPDQAILASEDCIRLGQAAGYLVAEVFDRARLAYMLGELGAIEEALELAQQALGAAKFTDGVGRGTSLAVRLHLQLQSAGLDASRSTMQTMESEMRAPAIWEVDSLLRARSEIALAEGDAAHALEVTQAHVAGLRQRGLALYLPEGLTGLAQALLMMGQVAEARQSLNEALARVQANGAMMIEWSVLYAFGKLEAEHGDQAAAGPHWSRARHIVLSIVAHVPSPELQACFLARPDVRELLAGAALPGDPSRPPAPAQPAPSSAPRP